MATSPDEFSVNITLHNLKRSDADKIINAAADIAGRVEVSMETIESQFQMANRPARNYIEKEQD